VYQIGVRSRVAATLDFENFEQSYPESVRQKSENLTLDYNALKRIKGKEEAINAHLFDTRAGHPVVYGEAIQLLHVSSGKYLTVSREETSQTEPENLKIYLSERMSQNSWFKMSPAGDINSEGDLVGNLSYVLLTPVLFAEEAVHVSAVPMAKKEQRRRSVVGPSPTADALRSAVGLGTPEIREINASFEKSAFRVYLFTEYCKSDSLVCGDYVYIEDAGHNTYLRPLSADEQSELSHADVAQTKKKTRLPANSLCARKQDDMKAEVTFAPIQDGFVHSSAIFVVERAHREVGGPVVWQSTYTLRHLKTGLFLSYGGRSSAGGRKGLTLSVRTSQHCVSTQVIFTSASASTMLKIGDTKKLPDTCTTLIECHNSYIAKDDEHATYAYGQRFIRSRLVKERDDGEPLVLRRQESGGIRLGMNARGPMMTLADDLRRGCAASGTTFDCESVAGIVEQLCTFVVPEILIQEEQRPSHSIQPVTAHQHMLREQDCVSLSLDILHQQLELVRNKQHPEAIVGENQEQSSWSLLTRNMLVLLRLMLIRNHENQIAASHQMPVLLSFVGTRYSDLAVLSLNELLSNRHVQEHRVGVAEVDVFFGMLRAIPLNDMALGALQQLCVCNGVAIESNQLLIAEFLLRGGVRDKPGTTTQAPALNEQDASGLVRIIAMDDLRFEVLFPGDESPRALTNKTRLLTGGMKTAEVKFLTAQLNLLAAVCMDRMYIAMDQLKQVLPFGHIKQLLILGANTRRGALVDLRSAFVRLATVLYVDCTPQLARLGTDMTFCVSELKAPVLMKFPTPTDTTNITAFAALQTLIREEMEHVQMNAYTMSMLELFAKLLEFNFFNANLAVLQQAITTLVRAITAQAMSSEEKLNQRLGRDTSNSNYSSHDSYGMSMKQRVLQFDRQFIFIKTRRALQGGLKNTIFDRTWVLRVLNSIPVMLFILCLVFATIVVTIYQGDTIHDGVYIFEFVIFMIFAIELVARMIAVGNVRVFFSDPFSTVDFLVVSLDLLMFVGAASSLGGVKGIRMIRVFRLIRVLRMVPLAIKIREAVRKPKLAVPWVLPSRYYSSNEQKLMGLNRMLEVLLKINSILGKHRFAMSLASLRQVHQRTLAGNTNAFSALSREITFSLNKTSSMVFPGGESQPVLAKQSSLAISGELADPSPMPMEEVLLCVSNNYDMTLDVESDTNTTGMLFNMILFEWPPLVQNAIQLLMLHHESTGQVIKNMQDFQLVSETEQQKLCFELKAEIKELWNLVDMNELWREVDTPEDLGKGLRVLEILAHMRAFMVEPDPLWMGGGLQFKVRLDRQVMLRNFGAFEACMLLREAVTFEPFDTTALPGSSVKSEVDVRGAVARGIYLLNNDFLCWFIHKNERHQAMAFLHLPAFIDDIVHNIGSTAVIMEMLRDNPAIIKLVPSSLFDALTRWIELQPEDAADPACIELLSLLVKCRGIVQRNNQLLVFLILVKPGVMDRLFLCRDGCGAEAQARARLMEEALLRLQSGTDEYAAFADGFTRARAGGGEQAGLDHVLAASSAFIGVNTAYFYMPRKLQFHIQVVNLFATCSSSNIIEAKIQSLFPLPVLLDNITSTSESMLPDVKIPFITLVFSAFVEVEFAGAQTNADPNIWELLETFAAAIHAASRSVCEAEGVFLAGHRIARSPGRVDEGRGVRSEVRYVLEGVIPCITCFFKVHFNRRNCVNSGCRSGNEVDQVLLALHAATQQFYTLQPACMSAEQSHSVFVALRLLARSADELVAPKYIVHRTSSIVESSATAGSGLHTRCFQGAMAANTANPAQAFDSAVHKCARHKDIAILSQKGISKCSSRIKELPKLGDAVEGAAIRFEPLLKKMIRHVQGLLVTTSDRKTLAIEHQASTLWLLRLFRTMVEDEWGFSLDVSVLSFALLYRVLRADSPFVVQERDHMGTASTDAAAWPTLQALAHCGACELCINLIANGIDNEVVGESMRLLTVLLLREGGSQVVQQAMSTHFRASPEGFFFAKISDILYVPSIVVLKCASASCLCAAPCCKLHICEHCDSLLLHPMRDVQV
jgi:hypothetical protein